VGFDQNDNQALVHPRRWGTKVNFAMALGVIIFLVLGGFGMLWMRSHKNQTANDTQQKMEDKR
jgi:hypothetical protein